MTTRVQEPSEFPLSEQITRDYRIVRLLGKGGMGEVYLAEQLRVGSRLVALKVLNRACSQDPVTTKRFENEISAAGSIQHRNVVTVYESRITDDGQIYVAMEFIRGKSLRALLLEEEVLPLESVVRVTRQICAGLGAAHKLGIVHRDIKPDNLMISADEHGDHAVKVVDFGIARFAEMGGPGLTTRDGIILGTPAYMSPEQALGLTGDKIDARSDIYSVGMVVYEMLTGTVAFHGDSWMNVLHQHLNETPRQLRQVRPDLDIPAQVEKTVLKSLEKDRERRQQTLAAFAGELEEAYSQAKADGGNAVSPTPSQVTTVDLTPKPPEPGSNGSEKRRSEHASLWNRARALTQSRQSLFFFSLFVIAIAILAILHLTGIMPLTARSTFLEYRIATESAATNGGPAPTVTRVKSGERISFEFKLARPGRLYVLYEDDYGFLLWLNRLEDGDAQYAPAEQWVRIPDRWILVDDTPRIEKFWVLHVPDGLDWSLTKAVFPEAFSIRPGIAEITRETAARLISLVKNEGVELKSLSDRNGLVALTKPAEKNQLAFYKIELEHIR